MTFLRLFVDVARDIGFVVLFFHKGGVRFRNRAAQVISIGVLFLQMVISVDDIGGPYVAALIRALTRGGIITLYLLLSRSTSRKLAVYYACFVNAVIIVCHNTFLTPLTRPVFFFKARLLEDPTANALLCIGIVVVCTVALYTAVYVMVTPAIEDETLTAQQVLSLILALGVSIYLNGEMKPDSAGAIGNAARYSVFCIILQCSLLFNLALFENLSQNVRRKLEAQVQLVESRMLLKSAVQKKESMEAIRAVRHDLKRHLSALRYLVERGNSGEAIEYIDELLGAKGLRTDEIRVGHDLLDAILGEKAARAREVGISLDISADLSGWSTVKPIDLCVVFGNTLDNAIEACEKVDPAARMIRMRSSAVGGYLVTTIENSYDGRLAAGDRLPATTKAEKELHGIGLRQVRKVLTGYNGRLMIQTDQSEGRFRVLLSVPLQTDDMSERLCAQEEAEPQ